jgi:hypothetical protein
MTTPSAQNEYYALGWSVNRNDNWWHIGGMSGTASEMARYSTGFNWAVLVNFTPNSAPDFKKDMDSLFWKSSEKIKDWGTGTEL